MAQVQTDIALPVNNFGITLNSPWSKEHITIGVIADDFISVVRNCFMQDSVINLIKSEIIISELIKQQINPYDIIISELNTQLDTVYNSYTEITSPRTASNFIVCYNKL